MTPDHRLVPRFYTWLIPLLLVAVVLVGAVAVRANIEASEAACKAVNRTKVVLVRLLEKTADLTDPANSPPDTDPALMEIRTRNHEAYVAFLEKERSTDLQPESC